jgi:uncharacterized membrane protein YhaH (DUF805 family)
MTEPLLPETNHEGSPQPATDWRAQRRQRRANRPDSWVWGAVLIAVGVFLLLQNMDLVSVSLRNWWALFIFIPAIGGFTTAVSQFRDAGRWTAQVTGSVIGACVVSLVALTFLLGWNWGSIWPLFLIAGGVAALVGGLGERKAGQEDNE